MDWTSGSYIASCRFKLIWPKDTYFFDFDLDNSFQEIVGLCGIVLYRWICLPPVEFRYFCMTCTVRDHRRLMQRRRQSDAMTIAFKQKRRNTYILDIILHHEILLFTKSWAKKTRIERKTWLVGWLILQIRSIMFLLHVQMKHVSCGIPRGSPTQSRAN